MPKCFILKNWKSNYSRIQEITPKATRRIQSSQDKKGSKGDIGFKSRTMSAAAQNSKKKLRWVA